MGLIFELVSGVIACDRTTFRPVYCVNFLYRVSTLIPGLRFPSAVAAFAQIILFFKHI